MVELLVVCAVIFIMSAMVLPYIYNYKKLYKSEDQTLKVMDLMQEASQHALNNRRTFRFEIDLTDNAALIIDENGSAAGTLVKSIPLENIREVRMDAKPAGVTKPVPPNYNDAVFANDAVGHKVGAATITNHSVWAARFRSDGSVVNAADVPISVNLYLWPPLTLGNASPRSKQEVRAITMFGGSGAIRYWKYDGTTFQPY
ncbi:MAG TPA: hypothetical protein VK468_02155 [Pyrinomonadaceae bacterium]|nr:hypothetical protein [Pyrinomonadaceae bacterium]